MGSRRPLGKISGGAFGAGVKTVQVSLHIRLKGGFTGQTQEVS